MFPPGNSLLLPACRPSRKLASKSIKLSLQFSCNFSAADCRVKIRADTTAKSRLGLAVLFAIPYASYMMYHMFAPTGVMQNFRASNGAYMYFAQNFLGPAKSYQHIYRPEFYQKEQAMSLYAYTKKIEALKAKGEATPDVHHPTMWH